MKDSSIITKNRHHIPVLAWLGTTLVMCSIQLAPAWAWAKKPVQPAYEVSEVATPAALPAIAVAPDPIPTFTPISNPPEVQQQAAVQYAPSPSFGAQVADNSTANKVGQGRSARSKTKSVLPVPSIGKPTELHIAGDVQSFQQGAASWYGPGFHNRLTANGERFNMHGLTAAHKTLPFGTLVRVHNVDSGKSVVVRINDRGPYAKGRIIDLSSGAADKLGLKGSGVQRVVLYKLKKGAKEEQIALNDN